MALNKWIGIGRLTSDPEIRQTQSGVTVARVVVAVNRPYQKDKEQQADFLPVIMWRGTAEFCNKYFHKGDPIQVEGRVETRSYDKNGVKHYITEIIADNISFVEGASRGNNNDTNADEWEDLDIENEDDLPF